MTYDEFMRFARTAVDAFQRIQKLHWNECRDGGELHPSEPRVAALYEEAAVAVGAIEPILNKLGNRKRRFGRRNAEVDIFEESLSLDYLVRPGLVDFAAKELRQLVVRVRVELAKGAAPEELGLERGPEQPDSAAVTSTPGQPKADDATRTYDVFISHASEDKEAVARPLAGLLRAHGLSVWLDETTLKLGDSLRRSIDRGLARCRYGIVILSPRFLEKEWPQRELDALIARETVSGEKAILPIWHELTRKTLLEYSPTLADRLANAQPLMAAARFLSPCRLAGVGSAVSASQASIGMLNRAA